MFVCVDMNSVVSRTSGPARRSHYWVFDTFIVVWPDPADVCFCTSIFTDISLSKGDAKTPLRASSLLILATVVDTGIIFQRDLVGKMFCNCPIFDIFFQSSPGRIKGDLSNRCTGYSKFRHNSREIPTICSYSVYFHKYQFVYTVINGNRGQSTVAGGKQSLNNRPKESQSKVSEFGS